MPSIIQLASGRAALESRQWIRNSMLHLSKDEHRHEVWHPKKTSREERKHLRSAAMRTEDHKSSVPVYEFTAIFALIRQRKEWQLHYPV